MTAATNLLRVERKYAREYRIRTIIANDVPVYHLSIVVTNNLVPDSQISGVHR